MVKADQTPADVGISKNYLNIKGIVQFRVALAFMKYHEYQLHKDDNVVNEHPEYISLARAEGIEYEINYWLKTKEPDNVQVTKLANILEAIMYNSKLADQGKVSFFILSDSDVVKVRDIVDDALAVVFFGKNPNISDKEIFSLLKKIHIEYYGSIDPKLANVKIADMPLVIVFDYKRINEQTGSLQSDYGYKADKIKWRQIDKFITSAK
jgi:hypothetical protein